MPRELNRSLSSASEGIVMRTDIVGIMLSDFSVRREGVGPILLAQELFQGPLTASDDTRQGSVQCPTLTVGRRMLTSAGSPRHPVKMQPQNLHARR